MAVLFELGLVCAAREKCSATAVSTGACERSELRSLCASLKFGGDGELSKGVCVHASATGGLPFISDSIRAQIVAWASVLHPVRAARKKWVCDLVSKGVRETKIASIQNCGPYRCHKGFRADTANLPKTSRRNQSSRSEERTAATEFGVCGH